MALAQEDIAFIKQHLGEWLAEQSLGRPPVVYEIELRERMVRVEEELKHQRELMREGFERMDARFAAQRADMDARFERMDERFAALRTDMDKRFEQVDKRFEQVETLRASRQALRESTNASTKCSSVTINIFCG
jgi:hypothetical protein